MKKFIVAMLMVFGLSGLAHAEQISNAVVVQANGDKVQFERALKLASNMREILTKAKFEIVVFGPAVKFLTADSEEAPLVQKMLDEGMKVIACGRSMTTDNVKKDDLAQGVIVVQYGAVHIVNRQKQGWQYFWP